MFKMIERISINIAKLINKADKDADVEIMQYGIELILQEMVMFLVLIVISLFLKLFSAVLVAILGYSLIRAFANGAHAQNRIVCSISYTVFIYGSIAISYALKGFDSLLAVLLFLVNIIILFLYSPGDTEERPIVSAKILSRNKYLSILLLVAIFAVAFNISEYSFLYANVLMIISTLACFLTLPIVYRLYGCNKSIELKGNEEVKI